MLSSTRKKVIGSFISQSYPCRQLNHSELIILMCGSHTGTKLHSINMDIVGPTGFCRFMQIAARDRKDTLTKGLERLVMRGLCSACY